MANLAIKSMAEDEGLEPPSPYGQRFSRPSDYHYPNPPLMFCIYFNIKVLQLKISYILA